MGMIYQLNLKKYSHFSPLNTNLKTYYSLWHVSTVAVKCSTCTLHLVDWLFVFLCVLVWRWQDVVANTVEVTSSTVRAEEQVVLAHQDRRQ